MKRFINLSSIITSGARAPWYLMLFSVYPVLALLSANAGQVRPAAGLRSLLVALAVGGLVFLFLWSILRQVHKSAFLATLCLALFYTYGHAYIYLEGKFPDGGFARWLGPGWAALFILALIWITRPGLTFASSAPVMNTMAVALMFMSMWPIVSSQGPSSVHALGADHAPVDAALIPPPEPPDVYYFILDSYGRADLLDLAYDYDNTEFLDGLRARGFYVAECSQSNYVRTEISMASSLNMMYLQDLDDEFIPESTARRTLWNSLKHSAVRHNLENLGYETVSFPTGYAWSELDDAGLYLSPAPFSSGLTEFEGLLLRTTLARYLQEWGVVDPDEVMGQSSRDLFNNVFDNMDEIAVMPGPQFVYAHLISPHPPFVFDAEGNPTRPADFWNEQRRYPYDLYARGYTNQLTYLNRKILQAVDAILRNSEIPPIIIVQGDHGPWMQPRDRRMWILNAYYFPGQEHGLYPSMSPVNTFRQVFNRYFGGKYDMLEDVSYFSPVPNLYDFTEMPNQCADR